jgi:hypothetical protein
MISFPSDEQSHILFPILPFFFLKHTAIYITFPEISRAKIKNPENLCVFCKKNLFFLKKIMMEFQKKPLQNKKTGADKKVLQNKKGTAADPIRGSRQSRFLWR